MSGACSSYHEWEITRRNLLRTATLGSLAWLAPSAISQIALRKQPEDRDVLIVVFLRGGMDGLNTVVPYGDDDYHRQRPNLRLKKPGEGPKADQALDLDGFFGLHPGLAPILPLYRDGQLGIVHAVGSADSSGSHFEAMMAMERGSESANSGLASGWLGRFLSATEGSSPLRAVSFSAIMPDSLRGGTHAVNLSDLGAYRLETSDEVKAQLQQLYAQGDDAMTQAGRETLELLDMLNRLDYRNYQPDGNAEYPDSDLGNGLRQSSFLIKNDLGVEIIALDTYGWDTHVTQGVGTGWHAGLVEHLGQCLAAFHRDIGRELSRVTVIVMTEFGRRVAENGQLGTDHGRGSCLLALGANVNGGKVLGPWPKLDPKHQIAAGDLAITTDYRAILHEVVDRRLKADPEPVFPGLRPAPVNLFRS